MFASASSAPAYSYDPYGVALQTTAPLTDFGYAGMFANADSGLNLTKYRAYDPVPGRWLTRDPIGESGDPAANLYAYVNGNPVGARDRIGLQSIIEGPPEEEPEEEPAEPMSEPQNQEQQPPAAGQNCPAIGPPLGAPPPEVPQSPRNFSPYKSPQTWANQTSQRGWTPDLIEDAINNGLSFPAPNNINPANGATRYVSPVTGQSVVIDNTTGDIIHVGGPGFRY